MLEKISDDIAFFLGRDRKRLERNIGDLYARTEIQSCRSVRHHWIYNRLEHMLLVSTLAQYLARKLGADERTCSRAGILHDFGQYGQGFPWPGKKKQLDPRAAGSFAKDIGETEPVQQAILSHHWHRKWPRTREGYIVVLADTVASLIETSGYLRHTARKWWCVLTGNIPHNFH